MIIFLGAGASTPFGYPTMKGLQDELVQSARTKENRMSSLLYSLLSHYPKNDPETVLQDLTLFETMSKRSGWMFEESSASVSERSGGTVLFSFREFIKFCRSLREIIEDSIFETYRRDRRKKLDLYGQLLKILGVREHHIYTTNYDMIIEDFCSVRHYDWRDGFAEDPDSGCWFWRPEESFSKPRKADATVLKLFKLHGSLGWKRRQNEIIERTSTEILVSRQPTLRHKEDVLIYPGGKELPEKEPFTWLYDQFENEMKETDRCLVIGFSFRDDYLNRVFRSFLRSGKGQLLVMSANCKDTVVAKNLLGLENIDGLKRYVESNSYVPIPCHIGEGDWLEMLKNGLHFASQATVDRRRLLGPA